MVLKTIIGTNCLVSDLAKDIEEGHLKSNLHLEGKDRAIYSVTFDEQPLEMDVEKAVSRIIEYQLYLAFKGLDEGYNMLTEVAKRFVDTHSSGVLTV